MTPTSVRTKVQQHLDVIEAHDDALHVWAQVLAEEALTRAQELDEGPTSGPLAGLTVGVKDMYDVAGTISRNGSAIAPSAPATRHATVVQRLFDAGAVLLGKTNLTEYAYFRPGPTRNPHRRDHTPGGSSSGSAAAVAAGMADVAIGSQTKGSMIRPASFCGVYGFKPSFGAISLAGATHLTSTLDHAGIFAARPDHLQQVFDVLRGFDGQDPSTRHLPAPPAEGAATALDVGYVDLGDLLDPDMRSRADSYAAELEQAGHRVRTVKLPFGLDEVEDVWQGVFHPEVFDHLGHLMGRADYGVLGEDIRGVIEEGQGRTIEDYFGALRRRRELEMRMDTLLAAHDLVLLPSAPGAAPHGLGATGDPVCTVFTTLLGLPVATIPVGLNDDGLPLGMQVVARRYQDERLLSAVAHLPADVRLAGLATTA